MAGLDKTKINVKYGQNGICPFHVKVSIKYFLLKIKIHLVYYIAILKLVYRDHKPLIYK